MAIEKVKRKIFKIRESGRSTDFISPSFGHGCLYDCSYCYMKRHKPDGLSIATNTEEILTEINNHSWFAVVEKPNQTHPNLITYDISCNEDFALHAKYHEWVKIFDFFKNSPFAMGSFATKYVNKKFLTYNPEKNIRIRFSLMPELMRDKHEPNTSTILERVQAIDMFIEAGYDVHINFSPIIVTDTWLQDYEELFNLVNDNVVNKNVVFAECIFLTHNVKKHTVNLTKHKVAEMDLWKPEIQETKQSQYGGENLRYSKYKKSLYIRQFIDLHDKIIKWNKIRYIF